jgi:hypothetical protein
MATFFVLIPASARACEFATWLRSRTTFITRMRVAGALG